MVFRYTYIYYIGKTKKEIKNNRFYNYVYYDDGDKVIYQSPDQGEKIKKAYYNVVYGAKTKFTN